MTSDKEGFAPRARQSALVVQELAEDLLVYDQDRFKAHCLNRTAALVWKHCDGQKTTREIALALEAEVGAPVAEEMVWLALGQLEKSSLLAERVRLPVGQAGISRREVIRRVGIAAAVALPVVTSIVAPKAAQAANCLPAGQGCMTSAECCSGICNAGACA